MLARFLLYHKEGLYIRNYFAVQVLAAGYFLLLPQHIDLYPCFFFFFSEKKNKLNLFISAQFTISAAYIMFSEGHVLIVTFLIISY